MGKQKVVDFTVAGAVRPVAVPSPTTEIEEVPLSLSRLLGLEARVDELRRKAAALALPRSQLPQQQMGQERGECSAGHGLEARVDELRRKAAALALLQQQMGQERGECSYRIPIPKGGGELRRRRPEEEGKAMRPQEAAGVEDVWAKVQRLQLMAQSLRENAAGFEGKMALMKAPMGEEMGEDITVLERRMNQIRKTWVKEQIAIGAALAIEFMLLIQIRTTLPSRFRGYMAGALACLWIHGSIPFFYGLLVISRTTKGFTCLVAWLIYVCYSLFVVYALCLISPIGDTFTTGLLGKC